MTVSTDRLLYTGHCDDCDRQVRLSLPATDAFVQANGGEWVKCRECGGICYCEPAPDEAAENRIQTAFRDGQMSH